MWHRLEFLSDDSLQGIIDATSRMIEELSQAVRKLRSDEWYNTKVLLTSALTRGLRVW